MSILCYWYKNEWDTVLDFKYAECKDVTEHHTRLCEKSSHWVKNSFVVFVVVFQLLSRVQLFGIPCTTAGQAPLSSTISWRLLKFMSIELVMLSNHLILCHPLSPPALYPSQHQGLFQWVSSLHQVAKVLAHEHQSFQWIFRVNFLWDWLVWSPCHPRL